MTRRALIAAAVLTLASTAFLLADANHPTGTRGILLIDKVGGQIRFIDPVTYKERAAFKVATNPHDFALTADRKTAYVPLYGDGIYGRNPNPGHEVVIVDTTRSSTGSRSRIRRAAATRPTTAQTGSIC